MKRTVSTTVKGAVFVAALAAPMFVAGGAKAEPRTHDGFYMQLATGLGYLSTSASQGPVSMSISGLATPFEALFGGTVGPAAIGGGFYMDYSFSPSQSVDTPGFSASGTLNDVSMYMVGAHVFGDIYPDPHGGFHVRPFLGYAALQLARNGQTGNSPGGPLVGAAVGYDFWVGDEWSIGVLGRFAYAALSLEGQSYGTISPALMASFTFH
jgi:hypothetical protein